MSELPKNWCTATLSDLCHKIVDGSHNPPKAVADGIPMLSARNVQNRRIMFDDFRRVSEEAFLAENRRTQIAVKDVLLTIVGTIGRVAIVQESTPTFTLQRSVAVLKPNAAIRSAYLGYLLESPRVQKHFVDNAKGTAQKGIYLNALGELELEVAPLNEQKCIADKLAAVLARVDACRERLDRIPAILKRFRQSVLAAATSGKLTEEWRKQNGLVNESGQPQTVNVTDPFAHVVSAPETWTKFDLGDVCEFIGGSQPPKTTFVHVDGPGLVRLIQIRDYKSDKHITFIPRTLAKRFCSSTDVMIGRYGPPLFQILRGLDGAYNVALMKAQPKTKELDLEYLYVFLRGEMLLKYVEAGSDRTAGQDGVRKELLNPYPIFLPTTPEQQEIVRRVEDLFAYADRLEARYTTARAQVEKLTPALLAKAFRGKLVPQDPNDEPASVLLERIRAARALAPAKPKSKKSATPRKKVAIEALPMVAEPQAVYDRKKRRA